MAEFDFTPKNIQDVINPDGASLDIGNAVIPTREEQEAYEVKEQLEQQKRDTEMNWHLAQGVPMIQNRPDLLTTPHTTGKLGGVEEVNTSSYDSPLMDLYRNMFNENAKVLQDAQKYAPTLGVKPQYLVDNPDEMERAREAYEKENAWSFLGRDVLYSSGALDGAYPELAGYRTQDPVGTAQALKNYQDIHATRSIFEDLSNAITNTGELFTDAFNSGSDLVKLYDAQMKAVNTGDIEGNRKEVEEIAQRLKEYEEQDRPQTALGKVVYDTVQQLTLYGTQGVRALQYVPKGMALAMAVAAPAAAAAGAVGGVGAAPVLIGAAGVGAAQGLRIGFIKEIQNQSMADRYWEMANTKDKNGKAMYSRKNMLIDSAVTGTVNAAIEYGLLKFGVGPITKVYGKNAAETILKNGAARKQIIDAGRATIAGIAAKAGLIQYGRSVAAEVAEEGAQSVVGSMAENIEYGIHGKGKWNSINDVVADAVENMLQAVPAAIGMGGIGAGAHTVGNYRNMRSVSSIKAQSWKEEYKRTVEKDTVQQLIEQKKDNKLAKENPQVYQEVIQNQAEKVGMDTMYVDAQELARSEKGIDVLNSMVGQGIVTAEQVDTAIANGTDLEIKTGMFTQMATDIDTDTLMDATTMNKGGLHFAAIRERNKRMESLREEIETLARNKSDALAEEIVTNYFKDADDDTQTLAWEVVVENPYDIAESYKKVLQEARRAYEEAINFDYYWNYQGEGVYAVVVDTEGHNNVQTGRGVRMSNNEAWYSDMYEKYGGRANKDQMLDVAYHNERKELAGAPQELLDEWDERVERAKSRYEALQDMEQDFETLSKQDYALRQTFSESGLTVYHNALQILSNAPGKAAQAAKENAFIYARLADRFAKIMQDYGDTSYTAETYAQQHPIVIGQQKKTGAYGQPITNMDIRLDEPAPVIEIQEKYRGRDWKDLRTNLGGTIEERIVSKKNKKGEYIPYVNKQTGRKIIVTKGSVDHFKTDYSRDAERRKDRQITLHYEMIEAIPQIIENGIFIEEHMDYHGAATKAYRIVAAVKLNGKIYGARILLREEKNKYKVEGGEYTHFRAYDITTKKESVTGGTSENDSQTGEMDRPAPVTDSKVSIRELLTIVNDNLEQPYVDKDGTPRYGIYFGDEKTGGVMYITPKENSYTQMAGTYSLTATRAELNDAIRREAAGEDMQAIYEKTGWYKGKDTKWRYEIPDEPENIYFDTTKNGQTLGEVYKNDALYRAYPELKDIKIWFEELPKGTNGNYTGGIGETITISESLRANIEKAKSTLIHEVQHAIQHKEGFARGANEKNIHQKLEQELDYQRKRLAIAEKENDTETAKWAKERIAEYKESIERIKDGTLRPFDAYQNAHGEQEARETQQRAEQRKQEKRVEALSKEAEAARERLNAEQKERYDTAKHILETIREAQRNEVDMDSKAYGIHVTPQNKGVLEAELGITIPNEGKILDAGKKIKDQSKDLQAAAKRLAEAEEIQHIEELTGKDVWEAIRKKAEYPEYGETGNNETAYALSDCGIVGYKTSDNGVHVFTEEALDVLGSYGRVIGKYRTKEGQAAKVAQKYNIPMEAAEKLIEAEQGKTELERKKIPAYDTKNTPEYNESIIVEGTYTGFSIQAEEGHTGLIYDEQYNQEAQQTIRAAYDPSTRAIHLFEAADQSSFIHEAGHMWLSELEHMAKQEGCPQELIQDLETIKEWGGYSEDKLAEYKGTSLEKEFAAYAAAIEKARQSGDAMAVRAAEERWLQERFARGFERYIAEGKAPIKELQGPFRKFKQWLKDIYKDLRQLGKEPPADVKRVMDRMVATDEEIERWAKIKELNAWDKKDFTGDLSGKEGDMIKKWADDIKEAAKEKLLAKYMDDIKKQDEADKKESLAKEKFDYMDKLYEENDLYKYEMTYNEMPEARAAILEELGYADEAEFKEALQKIGGTMEERTNAYMKEKQAEYDSLEFSEEDIRSMAEEQLASANGQIELSELEAAAMRKRLNSYIAECVKALRELGKVSGSDEEVAAKLRDILKVETVADKEKAEKGRLKEQLIDKDKQIKDLKDRLAESKNREKAAKEEADAQPQTQSRRKTQADERRMKAEAKEALNKIKEEESILAKDRKILELRQKLEEAKEKATKAENGAIIKDIRDRVNEIVQELNQARDVNTGNYRDVLRATREEMGSMKVSEAVGWRRYSLKAQQASHRADKYMEAGAFTEAFMEKANATKFYCMTRIAKENEDFLRKALGRDYEDAFTGEERTGITGILNRIKRAQNPVRMAVNERYFIEHLAYNLGITNRDGRPPLDNNGNVLGLQWQYIYNDLSPDVITEQNMKPSNDDLVAPWIRSIIDGKDRIDYQKDLTMDQMRDVHQAIQAIYKVGKRDYEAVSLENEEGKALSIGEVINELVLEAGYQIDEETGRVDISYNPEKIENEKTAADRTKDTLSDALLELTRPEVVLERIGKAWVQYIYRPIDKAARRELDMQAQANREWAKIYNMYSKAEWRRIRHDKVYTVDGTSKFTKEQILAIALNWGNKEGRQRIIDEINYNASRETAQYREANIEEVLAKALTPKDMDFLEAVWQQIGQYWPERNKVQERLYGTGMGRVQATPYTINGRRLSGGYYPIVYDPKLSSKASEQQIEDIAKAVVGASSSMQIGMGSTKKRAAVVKGRTVLKDLSIWPIAVNEAIHHICMREAVTDVYKVLNNQDIQLILQKDYGLAVNNMLKKWARDCWKTDVQRSGRFTRILELARRKTSFAVMAYRTSTAVLNACNIFPIINEIGGANTWQALTSFGAGIFNVGTDTYHQNREFVEARSPFMAERINTIDKDIQQHMTFDVNKNAGIISEKSNAVGNKVSYIGSVKDAINRFGYYFITETDLMLSMAVWKWKYEDSIRKQIAEGKTDEGIIRDNATFEADRVVRNVLGSGQTKDQPEIQRSNSLAMQFTPFYSYSNTVLNALVRSGYKGIDDGNKVAVVNAMLFWVVFPAILEQAYRSAVSGDDPDEWLKNTAVKIITGVTQGIPVARDFVTYAANYALDLPNYDSGNVLAISLVDEIQKALKATTSEKQDATDVARHATRALNRYTGFSDTLSDGFWSLMRFSLVDTDKSILELAKAVIFDRRYKTAEERQKAEKKKENDRKKKEKDDKK